MNFSVNPFALSPTAKRFGTIHRVQRLVRRFALALFFLGGFHAVWAQSDSYIALNLSVTQTNCRSKVNTWTARCVFGKSKWRIESHFSRNAVNYFYCDGTNVYGTVQLSMAAKIRGYLGRPESTNILAQPYLPRPAEPIQLTILPGTHPLSDTGANLPWLAYCSGGYLRLTNQLVPLIAASVRYDPTSFGFEHREDVFPDDLGLPKSLRLLRSEKLLKESLYDIRLRRTVDRVQTARAAGGDPDVRFVDGMVAGQYTVIRSTNVAGWAIPTHFTYEQFDVMETNLVSWWVATGTATDIRLAQEPEPLVSPTQSYEAIDFRFRSHRKILDEIVYVTNGVIPAMTDPRLQSIFKQAEQTADPDPAAEEQQAGARFASPFR